ARPLVPGGARGHGAGDPPPGGEDGCSLPVMGRCLRLEGIHMLIEHRGRRPVVPDSAYVAAAATLCAAVVLGEGARVLHGAVLTSEDGEVTVGENTVVMENALVRGRSGRPTVIGDAVMVGPHAHVNGARVEDEAFLATGASLFPGAVVGAGAEV